MSEIRKECPECKTLSLKYYEQEDIWFCDLCGFTIGLSKNKKTTYTE